MRIAILTKELPYPAHKSGGANTILNLFKNMSGPQIDIVYIKTAEEKDEAYSLHQLNKIFNDIIIINHRSPNHLFIKIKALLSMQSVKSLELYNEEVSNKLNEYDFVFIHDLPMIKYCSIVKKNKIFFVCDSPFKLTDSYLKNETSTLKKVILHLKKRIHHNMFMKNMKHFGKLLYISEVDLHHDRQLYPDLKGISDYINNGVDLDYFKPVPEDIIYDVVFVGNLGYKPNADAAEHLVKNIVPKLLEHKVNVKCIVVGKNPSDYLKSFASEHVEFTGFVDDIRSYVHKSKVFVSPLYSGAGMKNKILEAMSMNKLIIGSSISFEGISIKTDYIVEANNDDEFVEKIAYYLRDYDTYKDDINNRQELEKEYSWLSQSNKLLSLINPR